MPEHSLRSTAVAALLSIPLATGAALAQSQDTSDTDTANTGSSSAASGQQATSQQQDSVVATVGDAEIRGSEVREFVGMLPPQMRSQPPQMLVPLALEQLILRELIIQEARSQNLQEDPEVVALVEGATQTAEEDALVQIWLERETSNAVTDEAVQQAYDQAGAQDQQALPPLEQVRPQIEQFLRQQAVQEIRARLSEGADVVLYDPTGRPIPQQGNDQGPQSGGNQSGNATGGQPGSQSGNVSGGQSDDQSGGQSGDKSGSGSGNQSGNSGSTSGN